jgi:enamine deaminase RidA (YjgF/YER057c/UK114 family)
MSTVEQRLAEAGITLPQPIAPVANYVPYTVSQGGIVHISGQVSVNGATGERVLGVVGEDLDLAAAQDAARLCAINLLTQLKAAAGGDLERIRRVLKLGGFVQAGSGFFDIPQVVNGASEVMVLAFGDAGRHARSAVGVYRLPLNFAVEVDCVAELNP